MRSPDQVFSEEAPSWMRRLMVDFDLEDFQAAGIMGNAGHESLGLTKMQEIRPIGGGRGGLGPFQWTGPRRIAFERYCARTKQDPKGLPAGYSYLWRELSGHEPGFDYRHAIDQLKETKTLNAATDTFEYHYEKAGVKHTASRRKWAEKALKAYHARPGADAGADADLKRIQEKLVAMGHDPGPIDGIWGPKTTAAIAAALGV
jgi:hypothetical protein